MLRWRLGAVVLGTAIAVLVPLGTAGASSAGSPRASSHSAAPQKTHHAAAAVSPEATPIQLPFGRVDAALLALAGVPVLALATRRRSTDVPAASGDTFTAA